MSRLNQTICLFARLSCFLVLALVGRTWGQQHGTDADNSNRPNFVIILADDMGYGDSSVYGGWIETPNLERMAREGITFTDFHTSGVVCSPTRAGIMTGRYQQRAGIPGVINADPKLADHYRGLQKSETTFAETLKGTGYRSALFGKWHLGYLPKYNPMHHGFDEFEGFVSGNIDYQSHYDRMGTKDWWQGNSKVERSGYLTHRLTKLSVDFIAQNHEQPFCLFLSHGAVHSPIQAPDSPAIRGPDRQRDAQPSDRPRDETVKRMMQALDESVGEVLDALQQHGVAEKTLVFFLSDNGGAGHMRCDPLRGKKGSLWEGGHRVPALAWWPGTVKPGQKSDQLCSSLDLMPTMLKLAGASLPSGHRLDGQSLDELLINQKSLGERQLFWNGRAMRDGDWKLFVPAGNRQNRPQPKLFNLATDLAEANDIAQQHPERVERMRQALEDWKLDVQRDATAQPDYQKFKSSK